MASVLIYPSDVYPVNDDGLWLGELDGIFNPIVVKELGGVYTFSFDYVINSDTQSEVSFLVPGNIVKLNSFNQLRDTEPYRIQSVIKKRDNMAIVSVYCEHISYDLLEETDNTKFFEGTLQEMISSLFEGLPFAPSYVNWVDGVKYTTTITTGIKTYKPNSTSIRQRLLDICKLFGMEFDFRYLNVYIFWSGGGGRGTSVRATLGDNLIGLTETVEKENGIVTKTYDVDMIDLGALPDFVGRPTLSIGEWVGVHDYELGIQTALRLLRYEVDPFNIATAKVQLGNPVSDLSTRDQAIESNLTTIKSDVADLKESIIGDPGLTLEFASGLVKFDTPAIFNFTTSYDDILSITTGVSGTYEAIVFTEKIMTGGKYTGIKVSITGGGASGIIASIHAMCKVVV